jgi:hypothetical protein
VHPRRLRPDEQAVEKPGKLRSEKLTHQTDIYSLGVTMYRLLNKAFMRAALANSLFVRLS